MERSRRTSPLYGAWLEAAPSLAARIRKGVRDCDLEALGVAMEQSTLAFHACAMTAVPSVLYMQPPTVAALHAVRDLRDRRGIPVFATMDAGPHVKALCRTEDAPAVRRALARAPGVGRTRIAAPGAGIEVFPEPIP